MERSEVDPVRVSILSNALQSLSDEMGVALVRAAYSTNVKDRKDCSCAIYTLKGEMLAQGEFMPVHLGIMPNALREILKDYPIETLRPGDVIIDNDPFRMGSHMWDIMLFSVVYHKEEPIAIVGDLAHHIDIGGSRGRSTEIFDEGIRIPPVKLWKEGVLDEEIFNIILTNVRTPYEVKGDLLAQLAALYRGKRGIKELFEEYGSDVLKTYFGETLNYSDRIMRASIANIPDGEAEFEDSFDAETGPEVKVKVRVKKIDTEIYIDFEGSGPPTDTECNNPWSLTLSASYYAVKAVVAPRIPTNAGAYRCIHVIKPRGESVLNVHFPHAVRGCTSNPSQRVVDVVIGAFSKLVPQRVSACHQDWPALLLKGVNPITHRIFSYVETYGGGTGAKHNDDGADAHQTHMSNTKNAPVEAIELRYPLKVVRYALVPDTEGAGKFRGGLAIIRQLKVLTDTHVAALTRRYTKGPYGLFGGKNGQAALLGIITPEGEAVTDKFIAQVVPKGTQIFVRSCGGGGWGNPFERDPQKVRSDVLNELVNVKRAMEVYKVKIDPETMEIDYEKTEQLRAQYMEGRSD